jgi:cytochrome c5
MSSTFRSVAAASVAAWAVAVGAVVAQPSAAAEAASQKSTNDAVYSKAQADGAKAQYEKICAECHPFSEAGKKKPKDVPLGGETFFENWTGRTVGELASTIALTMPNDGSAVVSEAEALNLVAFILQKNGFPAGKEKLSKAGASAVVARPKKK